MGTYRRHHPIKRQSRGVAAVEFGLLITPMVLMLFGATEFGRAIYTYNTLDKTVRDAVRHLSQHGPGDATIQLERLIDPACLIAQKPEPEEPGSGLRRSRPAGPNPP